MPVTFNVLIKSYSLNAIVSCSEVINKGEKRLFLFWPKGYCRFVNYSWIYKARPNYFFDFFFFRDLQASTVLSTVMSFLRTALRFWGRDFSCLFSLEAAVCSIAGFVWRTVCQKLYYSWCLVRSHFLYCPPTKEDSCIKKKKKKKASLMLSPI